jgi:hypothetical protein
MVRRHAFLLFLIALAAPASYAFAQTVNAMTGTVIGKVSDDSDAVLPGVSVTIKGAPAMMGAQNAVTA